VESTSVLRGGARHFPLGGPLEGPVLQQGELSMVCVGLLERDLKNFGGPLGGQAKFWGGSGHPLSSAPECTSTLIKGFEVERFFSSVKCECCFQKNAANRKLTARRGNY